MQQQQQQPDTSHDEELARSMQMEYDRQSRAAENSNNNSSAATLSTIIPSGTYVDMPDDQRNMVSIDFEPQLEVNESEFEAPSRAQQSRAPVNTEILYAKMSFLIRTIAIAGAAFWLFSLTFKAWWFIFTFGIVFCPIGFLGVKYNNYKYTFIFFIYLTVDSIVQLMFPFVYVYGFTFTGLTMTMLLAVMECMATYYTFKFCEMMKLRASGASIEAMADIL